MYSLGGFQIREHILFLGLSPQKRWNDKGNVHEIRLFEAGLSQHCARLFSAKVELEQAIKSHIKYGMITPNVLEDGSLAYSLANEIKIQISRSFEQEELVLQGLLFTTHIYPREEVLHDS